MIVEDQGPTAERGCRRIFVDPEVGLRNAGGEDWAGREQNSDGPTIRSNRENPFRLARDPLWLRWVQWPLSSTGLRDAVHHLSTGWDGTRVR
jgi:hypothetical protein